MLGAGDEGRSCDASWAVGLVSELMQELHSQLCDTSVHLHREGNEAESVRLPTCICSSPLAESSRQAAAAPADAVGAQRGLMERGCMSGTSVMEMP
jgi:hypothetical protein